ncbi:MULTISPECIES: DUF4232 domain-containing protein [unclassified Streptomyces]|uniref:DUF4232 domain-containing protein n=1 Tax=Streptomyces sp. NPDC127129 TaxID=3345373 RepID=UPI00362742FD
MSTVRNSWRTCAVGVAAVAALLATTACESGGTDNGKSPSTGKSPTTSRTPGASGTPTPSAKPSTSDAAPSPGRTSGEPGDDGNTRPAACNDNDLSITLSYWRQDSGQNVLITAGNITGKACTLYHYPYVGFGAEIDGPIEAMGARPRAIATIGPKEKAYAGVYLFRGGEKTVAAEALSIGYQDRAPDSNGDVAMLDISPSDEMGALNVGTNPRVTYWNRDLGAIEDLLFRSGAD